MIQCHCSSIRNQCLYQERFPSFLVQSALLGWFRTLTSAKALKTKALRCKLCFLFSFVARGLGGVGNLCALRKTCPFILCEPEKLSDYQGKYKPGLNWAGMETCVTVCQSYQLQCTLSAIVKLVVLILNDERTRLRG